MKPNRFFSFLNSTALVCLVFILTSFGQGTDNKTAKGNSGNGEKVSQVQNSPDREGKDTIVKISDQRYRIGYQDTIEIIVYNNSNTKVSGNFPVNPDGTIFLPRLKDPVVVVCKTELELKNEITESYKRELLKNPFVSVRVSDQKSQAFGVMGAVQKPGYYYINRKVHLLELLTMAGGPDLKQAGTQLFVARTGSSSFCQEKSVGESDPKLELISFKLKDVQKAKEILWMQPGDIVSVLEADPFYVMGNVNKSGMYLLKGPTTLTQAIATAEGFKPAAKKDYLRILRQKEGSNEREELIFKLKDIDDKKIPDPLLQANDIVAVSEDKTVSILNSLKTSLTGGIPSLFYRIP